MPEPRKRIDRRRTSRSLWNNRRFSRESISSQSLQADLQSARNVGVSAASGQRAAVKLTRVPPSQTTLDAIAVYGGEEKIREDFGLGPDIDLAHLDISKLTNSQRDRIEDKVIKPPLYKRMLGAAVGAVTSIDKSLTPDVPGLVEGESFSDAKFRRDRYHEAMDEDDPRRIVYKQGAFLREAFHQGKMIGEFSEVVGETGAQGFGVFADGRFVGKAKVPDIFNPNFRTEVGLDGRKRLISEGIEKTQASFTSRDTMQQIIVGAIDPFVVKGVAKGIVVSLFKGAARLSVKTGLKKLSPAELAAQTQKAAFKKMSREVTTIPIVPLSEDIIATQLNPRIKMKVGRTTPLNWLQRKVLNRTDPSSLIQTLPVGSLERTLREADFVKRQIDELARANTTIIMARHKVTDGDAVKIFGVHTAKYGQQVEAPRAWNVTQARVTVVRPKSSVDLLRAIDKHVPTEKIVDLEEAPFMGNVFQNPDNYVITPAMRQYIDNWHKTLDDVFKVLVAEGVDVKYFGSAVDALLFFPRVVVDARTGKKSFKLSTSGRSNPGAHRLLDEMEDSVLENGGRYLGPDDALKHYLEGAYKAIGRKRLEDAIAPFAKTKKVNPELLKANAKVIKISQKMGDIIEDMPKIIRGFMPSGPTIAAMKRHFPGLKTDIDEAMKFSVPELTRLVNAVSDDVFDAAKISRKDFRDTLFKVQEGKRASKFIEDTEQAFESTAGAGKIRDLPKRRLSKSEKEGAGDNEELFRAITGESGPKALRGTTAKRATAKTAFFSDASSIHETVRRLIRDQNVSHKFINAVLQEQAKIFKETRASKVDELIKRMGTHRGEYQDIVNGTAEEVAKQKRIAKGTSFKEATVEGLPLAHKFDKEDADLIEKILIDNGNGFWSGISNVSGKWRQLRTIADFGAPLVQGLPLLMRSPSVWATATTKHYQSFFDTSVRTRYIAENSLDIVEYLKYGGGIGSTEWTDSLKNGGFLAALPTRLTEAGGMNPIIATGIRQVPRVIDATTARFSNSFETFMDLARIETWKGLKGSAKTPEELGELAAFVNKITGSISSKAMGVPLTWRQFEAAIPFFAPQYFRAMSAVAMDAFSGGLRGDQARKALTSLFAGVVSIHVAGAHMLGQDANLDPTKPGEFLRWKIFGQWVGFGSKQLTFMKIIASSTVTAIKKPKSFLNWNLLSPDAYAENPALRAIRNQASPIGSIIADLVSGSDALGNPIPTWDDPVDLSLYIGDRTLPFWAAAAAEVSGQERDLIGSALASLTEFGGLTSFPVPPYTRLQDLRDKYAKEDYGFDTFDELRQASTIENPGSRGVAEEQEMLARHPDLRAAEDLYTNESRSRATRKEQQAVLLDRENIKLQWLFASNEAGYQLDAVVHNDDASDEFREEIHKVTRSKRDSNRLLVQRHPEVIRITEEFYDQLALTDPVQAASNEFFDRITSFTTDGGVINELLGHVDYNRMDAVREEMEAKYGAQVMAQVNNAIKQNQLEIRTPDGQTHKLSQRIVEFMESYTTLRPYWDTYKEVVPEDEQAAYDIYQRSSAARQDLIVRTNPRIIMYKAVVAQKKLLLLAENKEMDMALIIFHGHSSKNIFNQNLLRNEYIRELQTQWAQ